ncbi:MAG TPA: nitroreductase family deazaflavin-dependent oxidoreductase [Acidimicrobiales bacterium]|nr:nitroreductase family deazaflavin-dependent oxidoreductase [Acidimicrobiales bacterium]
MHPADRDPDPRTGSSDRGGTYAHYDKPGPFSAAFNRIMRGLTSAGLSVYGSRVIEVRGRKSGQVRRTVVNLLELDGSEYLVSPRGETDWVRNLRADDGRVTVRLGRRRVPHRAVEVDDAVKVAILRAYLEKWKFEVGMFFDGVGPTATDAEMAAVAPEHPVFQLVA